MKLLSCRRAPDAKRGCPPVTVVTRASSPSIPEAGAAPRHLSSGGQVGGGSLGLPRVWQQPSLNYCTPKLGVELWHLPHCRQCLASTRSTGVQRLRLGHCITLRRPRAAIGGNLPPKSPPGVKPLSW